MRGHIVKRGSRYAVVIDVGRDPKTGRRKQKWTSGFTTKKAAEDGLTEILGKALRGDVLDPDKTRLADYLTGWLNARHELAPLSVTQYASVIKNHIRPAEIGSLPIGRIRRAHVRQFEAALVTKGLASSTRNVIMAVVSKGLGDAVLDDLISSNPAAGRRRTASPGSREHRFTVWTQAELRSFLAQATSEDEPLSALWRLAVATGARRGELLGVRWLDFAPSAKTVTIAQQAVPTGGGVSLTALKTKGSHRTVTIDDETVEALTRHRGAQKVERSLAGDAYVDRDLIFADAIGAPLYPQRITEAFGALRKTSGIRPGRLHDLRHSVATHLLTAGVPVRIVAARLGHSSPVVTSTTYVHVLPRSDEQAAQIIGELLSPTPVAARYQNRGKTAVSSG